MSENYAVPGGPAMDYLWRTLKAGYTPSRGDFVGRGTGGDAALAVTTAADFANDVLGVCNVESRDGDIEVYTGPICKAPIETGATVVVDEPVYLGSVNTVYGDADAGAGATAIGVALRVETGYVVFRSHFYYDRTPADAS